MEKEERKIRVLLGKPGLCGHDRGVLILAMALRDSGMEVIYSGRHISPEMSADDRPEDAIEKAGKPDNQKAGRPERANDCVQPLLLALWLSSFPVFPAPAFSIRHSVRRSSYMPYPTSRQACMVSG